MGDTAMQVIYRFAYYFTIKFIDLEGQMKGLKLSKKQHPSFPSPWLIFLETPVTDVLPVQLYMLTNVGNLHKKSPRPEDKVEGFLVSVLVGG